MVQCFQLTAQPGVSEAQQSIRLSNRMRDKNNQNMLPCQQPCQLTFMDGDQ